MDGVGVDESSQRAVPADRQRLQDLVAWLRSFVENIPEAIWACDAEGQTTFVNDAACEIFGYERETFLTLRIDDLVVSDAPTRLARHTRGLDDLATYQVAVEGKTIALNDVTEFAGGSFAGPKTAGYRVGIGAPILRRDKPVGAIFVGSRIKSHSTSQVVILSREAFATNALRLAPSVDETLRSAVQSDKFRS